MNRKPSPIHGWLVLDKPLGLTSTQALGKARRLVGGTKAGHGGTLDPLATGVLALAFGEATKVIPYILDGDKEYEFTVRWGQQTATDDAEGEVIAESPNRPTEAEIRAVFPSFFGQISQLPPLFSAIKVHGQRAYDLARAGQIPDIAPRPVMIYKLELVEMIDKDHTSFRVACGKGMYVRALARDLAILLGTKGHVVALRRTKAGPFRVENAFSLEKLEDLAHKGQAEEALLEIGAALDDIPGLNLSPSEAQRLRAGQSLLIRPDQLSLMEQPVIMASFQGQPVALVEVRDGSLTVVRGFTF